MGMSKKKSPGDGHGISWASSPRWGSNKSSGAATQSVPEADQGKGRSPFRSEASSPAELQKKIQQKAYELYQKKGCADGNDLADWFEAERLVKSGR